MIWSLPAQAGWREPFAQPEGPAPRVDVKDGQVKPGRVAFAGQGFGMGKEGPAMTLALRPGAKEHQAKVGVAGFGEAVGHFGHA